MTDLIPRTERSRPAAGRLRQVLRDQPLLGLLPLRLFLGVTFTFAGLQKLADPSFFDPANPQSFQGQLAFVRDASPLRFMLGPVADHAVLLGVLMALGELSAGIATLLGLWQRLAAAVGASLALSLYLTVTWQTRPYYYGADIGIAFAWTPFILLGAPVLSLDAWRLGRRQLPLAAAAGAVPAAVGGTSHAAGGTSPGTSPAAGHGAPDGAVDTDRRALLATGAVGAVVLAAAGLDAGVGRALRGGGGGSSGTAAAPPPSAAASTTAPGGAPTTAPGSAPSTAPGGSASPAGGTVIGSVRDLPVGGALRFTDPGSGAVAYAVQPAAGQFRAFSAICSHAGCTVAYARSVHQFRCPCHGGVYDGRTGDVLAGPPPAPLRPIQVTESGGKLVVPGP